jgi:hypothetical protein
MDRTLLRSWQEGVNTQKGRTLDHHLIVRTEVLDQMAKSLMQSEHANTRRRRRLVSSGQGDTRAGREAAEEGELLDEGLAIVRAAQNESWKESS